jgi:hypothetical protein
MLEILKSEFFWGIVVGLLLSFIGGWVQANLTVSINEKTMKKTVINFCLDTIRNLQSVITEMDKGRDRAKVIFAEFLALIDQELVIYQRNREHMIRLPETNRAEVRDFMNGCAVKKVEIAWQLDQFSRLINLANESQAAGRGPEAQRFQSHAVVHLQEAHQAADRLVALANKAPALLSQLKGAL